MSHETVLIGFLVALTFHELTGISPGGIVVPAFLALYAGEPARLAGTAIAAAGGLGIYRLLSARLILFGRRRFFVLVTASGLAALASGMIVPALLPEAAGWRAVGIVVPGLLADACRKQGTLVTASAAFTAMTVTYLLSRLILSW